jgi:hypothetical protein
VQNGSTFVITNTRAAIPVIAGTGTTVTNTPGGAIVNANVALLQAGTGITVSNNGGTWTINAPGSGSASLGTSGWQAFPSGLIMQWGGPVTVPRSGGFVQVTFPRAFPNNFYNGSVTPVGAATQDMGLLNPTTTGMRIYTGSGDGSSRQAYWQALGD